VSARDYYEVLGVERSATDQQIKSAYRKLALKHHPDRNPGDRRAEEEFKAAAEAYAVLADPDKRSRYDRFGHAGVSSAGGPGGFDPTIFADFNDILGGLGDIFGFGDVFGGRRSGPRRGADLRYDLEISFDESAKGQETTVQIPREEQCGECKGSGAAPGSAPETCSQCRGRGQLRYQQGFLTVARTCPQCRGAGQVVSKPCTSCRGAGRVAAERKLTVKIPAGIADGQRLRLAGEGEPGPLGGPPGDLYVVIHVRDHELFHREGDDLYAEVSIAYPTAVLGGEIKMPTPWGDEALRIPEGAQSGQMLRMRGKGMPNVNGRGHGDLHVRIKIDVPRKLTREQRGLIEKLAATLPASATPKAVQEDKNLFDRVKDIFG
jgi:molecular chaperone DnaJ